MSQSSNTRPAARHVQIGEDQAGQRIDNFLLTHLKGVPKSHVYRILRTGQVRINGGRAGANRKLATGDIIRVPPVRMTGAEETPSTCPEPLRRRLEASILFEDSELLVLDKPSGIAVHGGSGLAFGVIEGLRLLHGSSKFLELVHRLDRDTSGCLVIAKKRSALRRLHEQFRENQVQKTYVALLSGQWNESERTIDVPLEKNVLQSGERLVKASSGGKPAVTHFRREAELGRWTLVRARPETGRTHQIRVHAKSMGYPIAGDERYCPAEDLLEARAMGLRRLFLHAEQLVILHPADGRRLVLDAPVGEELLQVVDRLR